ncbi:MAG: phosphotransferase family protein [Acidothermaceae bacterium]
MLFEASRPQAVPDPAVQSVLPEAARRWVCDVTGMTLVEAAYLPGATSSRVYLLRFDDGTRLVLRLHTNDDWLAREPDLATREAHTLRALSGSTLVVPALIAVDEAGEFCGRPAVLMSQLMGRADCSDASPARLRMLADAIRPLHAMAPPADLPPFRPYLSAATRAVPIWTSIHATWQHAIEICALAAPAGPICFIHRDFHPGNVLIEGASVAGIVDWPNACAGPPEIDVAHCKVNFAITHGLDAATRFGAEFATDAKRQAYWDLVDCLDMFEGGESPDVSALDAVHALGAPPLTIALVNERYDAYVTDALRRWHDAG